jgi:hypothetical protein
LLLRKHLKNAIDLAEHNKRFYVVFEEGVVEVYERV